MVAVNWEYLVAALQWYEARGYKRVDLPWHASLEAIQSTLDDLGRSYELGDLGLLVGSAEQSFVDALMNGTLGQGKFVSLTPCFRKEPVFDATHHPYFMKVELFDTNAYDGTDFEIALEARTFMTEISGISPDVVPTEIGYDLEINGIEVGSYSSRKYKGYEWTCGTGIAEPRFSIAIAR
ncbi:hypothetical protein [Mesorhizobium sp. SP-1A]|uniref:hypothetical protein n=1 Tax=Mesorhizobium sp. SP-1A TaxID=3077840 RepID=UPI0028F729B2|nr:hypothetical protein [Mesorhizobium sp. SP-1A]